MAKYWFKARKFGWGFTPVTWQGWLVVAITLTLILMSAYVNNMLTEANPTNKQGFRFLIDLILILGVSTYFSERKTEGEVKWRWWRRK